MTFDQTGRHPDPSVVRITGPWRHFDVHANGIRFHAVEANDPGQAGSPDADRPLVLLLHGFGSFWWSWRHQLRGLTDARVVAVDLRGYGGSDKPPRGYDGWTLAGDTAGLIRALGHTSATLVGHAEGGLVCWATANLHSRLVDAIAVVSSPHPIALRNSTIRDTAQSWPLMSALLRYQVPMAPERTLTRHHGAELERLVRMRAGTRWMATDDFATTIAHMRTAIMIPGVAHCALEYQRWAVRSQFRTEGWRFLRSIDRVLTLPVLHLQGAADPYMMNGPVHRSVRYAPEGTFVDVPDVGHYAHEEDPVAVNEQLVNFLRSR